MLFVNLIRCRNPTPLVDISYSICVWNILHKESESSLLPWTNMLISTFIVQRWQFVTKQWFPLNSSMASVINLIWIWLIFIEIIIGCSLKYFELNFTYLRLQHSLWKIIDFSCDTIFIFKHILYLSIITLC